MSVTCIPDRFDTLHRMQGLRSCLQRVEPASRPTDFDWTGFSYDNTGQLGHSTWRHVKFVEGGVIPGQGGNSPENVPGDFLRMCANTAKMQDASKLAQPARSCVPSLAEYLFSRMFAMDAPTALCPAHSV